MVNKTMSVALVAASMAFGAGAAQAESFAVLGAVPTTALSADQMKSVAGKDHIYQFVDVFMGVELPAGGAAATMAAAPKPQNAGAGGSDLFIRSPSRDAAVFVSALGAPLKPTRQ